MVPHRERSPDRPPCRESLYRSRHPCPQFVSIRTECLLNQLIALVVQRDADCEISCFLLTSAVKCMVVWLFTYFVSYLPR